MSVATFPTPPQIVIFSPFHTVVRGNIERPFVVMVVRSGEGDAGALVDAVSQDEDVAGEARLDDAVGAGEGQVVGASGRPGEPQRDAVRSNDDLHVCAVLLASLRQQALRARPCSYRGQAACSTNSWETSSIAG
jgi:hypothetical protein